MKYFGFVTSITFLLFLLCLEVPEHLVIKLGNDGFFFEAIWMTLLNSTLDKMLIGAFGRMVKSVESSHSLHAVRPHYCIPLTQIGGMMKK